MENAAVRLKPITFATLQNSMIGFVKLHIDVNSRQLLISYAKAKNPKKASEIKKGDKIYDYENEHYFSITYDEAIQILDALKNSAPKASISLFHDNKKTGVQHILKITKDNSGVTLQFYRKDKNNESEPMKFMFKLSNPRTQKMFMDFLAAYDKVLIIGAYAMYIGQQIKSFINSILNKNQDNS